ncbi:hypothetical protein F4803DRAFT_575420 [Xylaria telfairii]|nr:hypothetical protein F4803DRAFT_575420 [Xylaria telfairii]
MPLDIASPIIMTEPQPAQLLTEENVQKLRYIQRRKQPSESLTSSDFLPIEKLEKEKRLVYNFLFRLKDIGAEGERIRDAEDVYITGIGEVGYRGNAVPEPDIQDPSFWETKLLYLQQTYGPRIELTRAKRGVCYYMRLLSKFGREGRKILAEYELYLVSKDDVHYRGNADPEPDLQDPTYWEAQRQYTQSKYWELLEARFPRPISHRSLNVEEKVYAEDENVLDEDDPTAVMWAWSKRKREIRAWSSAQHAGKGHASIKHDDGC